MRTHLRHVAMLLLCLNSWILFGHCQENGVQWSGAQLPADLFGITASKETLWVFGADETIASSRSQGKTWNLAHVQKNGEVLLNGSFLNDEVGFITGTNGTLLSTTDGGKQWSRKSIGHSPILMSAFGSEKAGVVITPEGAFSSDDGWQNWAEIKELKTGEIARFKYLLAVAAIAPDKFIILSKLGPAQYYDSRLLVSQNSGKTWEVIEVPHTTISTLTSANGEFWIAGTEVIDRDKIGGDGHKGGHAVPMLMHSADGKKWESSLRPGKTLSVCNLQGCLAFDGVWVDAYKTPSKIQTYQPAPTSTLKWAASKETLCIVSGLVMCTDTRAAKEYPENGKTLPPALTLVSLEEKQEEPPICISCPLAPYYVDQEFGGSANVKITVAIKPNGTIEHFEVFNAPTEQIRQQIEASVKLWLFNPVLKDGERISAEKRVTAKIAVIKPR